MDLDDILHGYSDPGPEKMKETAMEIENNLKLKNQEIRVEELERQVRYLTDLIRDVNALPIKMGSI